jgi:hypothetical protein
VHTWARDHFPYCHSPYANSIIRNPAIRAFQVLPHWHQNTAILTGHQANVRLGDPPTDISCGRTRATTVEDHGLINLDGPMEEKTLQSTYSKSVGYPFCQFRHQKSVAILQIPYPESSIYHIKRSASHFPHLKLVTLPLTAELSSPMSPLSACMGPCRGQWMLS